MFLKSRIYFSINFVAFAVCILCIEQILIRGERKIMESFLRFSKFYNIAKLHEMIILVEIIPNLKCISSVVFT